jgi:hypothetical protein
LFKHTSMSSLLWFYFFDENVQSAARSFST